MHVFCFHFFTKRVGGGLVCLQWPFLYIAFWYLKHVLFDLQYQDVYFDDESAEVVISSLRLGDDQGR